jgi:type IV secretory pathway TraG/TraD family ATPase VirD4
MNFVSNHTEPSQVNGRPVPQGIDATPLIHFSRQDALTVKQSFEGIFVAGQSGSGKTSGPGQGLARAMLRNGYGFLVPTTKPDDARTFAEWARLEGRGDDVRLFSPEKNYCFGLLDYAYNSAGVRGSGDTENVVALLTDLLEVKNRNRGSAGDQQFWIDSMRRMLGHFLDLLAFSGETITFAGVNKILQSSPQSVEEVKSVEWQEKSYCNSLVDRAVANKQLTAAQQSDLALALEYVLSVLPRMEERLRSGIMATLDSITYPFLRGRLAALCDGKTNLCPEDCFRGERAAIIILDLPIKQFHQTGQFIQILWKRLWQQAAEKRDIRVYPRALCLFCDESQNFSTRYDSLFQATARSSRVSSVFLTQNLDSLQSQIGKPETEALLGNFNLKVMCSTDHTPTAEWAAKKIGESWVFGSNSSVSLGGEGGASGGVSEQKRWIVPPEEFVKGLRKGGEENSYLVDAIALRSGMPFLATNNSYIRVRFPQKIVSQYA